MAKKGPQLAAAYLAKAQQFLADAEAAVHEDRYDSALLLAVHAGISSGDAACAALIGEVSASRNHMEAVKLLERAAGSSNEVKSKARQLADLVGQKNTVEYQSRRTKREEADRAVVQARRLFDWAAGQVDR